MGAKAKLNRPSKRVAVIFYPDKIARRKLTAAIGVLFMGERLTTLHIVDPVLSRSVVLGTTLHRPSTHALREVSRLILEVAPALLNS